jgi:hypothetical protein
MHDIPNPTLPPEHVLTILRERHPQRWDRNAHNVVGHNEQIARMMERGHPDDIDGFIGARYWTHKNGRHRQLTEDAIMDMHALACVAKRKRQGLPVDQIVKAFRDKEAEGWRETERLAEAARAAGDTRSIYQRLLEAHGRAPRPG